MRLAAASSRIASRQREFSDARYRASGTCSASPCPTTTSAPPTSSTAPQHRRHQTPQRSLPQRRAISALSGPSWALNSLTEGIRYRAAPPRGSAIAPFVAQHRFCCAAAPARRTHGRHWPKRCRPKSPRSRRAGVARRSGTQQGMAQYTEITEATGMPICFCDPHSPC